MSTVGTVQSPILVGRDDILVHADRLIAEASQGHGHTLFFSGQAGLGKTRLMRSINQKAKAAGFRINGGAVTPTDRQVPLASIRDLAFPARGDPEWGSLAEDLLALEGEKAGDTLGARRLLVRAVADRFLDWVDRPTMVSFSDIQWTDEMSLEVIGELARHATDRPLLILGDYRGDELPTDTIHREWRARLLSQRQAEEVKLRRLTLEETGIATTLILGGDLPAPSDVVEAIYERTNGIPLHIEELLAALDPAARADGRRILQAGVPDTIGDAVLSRFAQLSDEAHSVAHAAAVIGRCFNPETIAGMIGRPLRELEPAIEELVDATLLFPFNYSDQGYYDFRHQLLRDAVYDAVPPSEVRRFHAQAAEFVLTLQNPSIVYASRHYERAGLRPEAYRASLTAAGEADRVSARQEAFELYERAIANMPADLPAGEQAELWDHFQESAAALERNDVGEDAASRARELYLAAARPLDAARAQLWIGHLRVRRGGPTRGLRAAAEQALAEILDQPVTDAREKLRALVLVWLADARLRCAEFDGTRELVHEARDLAEKLRDLETLYECDLLLARIDILAGRYESGFRDGIHAAREARSAGFEWVAVTGYRNLGVLAARAMDQKTAELAIGEGLRYADSIEQSHCRQLMATTTAFLDWSGGRWMIADERARQELADRGCALGVMGAQEVMGLVALGRGRADEARRWLEASIGAGDRIGEVQFILTPMWGLAEAELLAGDPDGAAARCADAWEIATETGERALFVPFVVTGTRSLLAARKPDVAERWLARAREHLAGWEPVAGPALSHADGLLRLAAGSFSSARESLERAVRGWEERGREWEALWARLDLASCFVRMNRPADAADAVAEVRRRAEALGSEPLLVRAAGLDKANRRRGLEDEPWRPLTTREFEVARAIAAGMTNAEIAAELFVAPRTVGAHVEHILAKLGVARRAEIAAWVATVRPVDRPASSAAPSSSAIPARG
jgi:DNA-binding CsgD family transcriptional regulator